MFQQALRRTVTPKLAKALTPRATAAMMTIPVAAFGGYNAIKMNNPSAFASTQTNIEHGGLTPADFTALTVSKIDQISADSSVYYFSLSSPTAKLNMPITSYVVAKADVDGEAIFRPYTPLADAEGEMALVVKTYPNAKMGSVFKSLQVGDSMNFKGPLKKFDYTPNQFDHVTMIAGGTGITPIFQLMEAMTANTDDKTTIHLLYGSQTPQDILIKPLIDKMVSEHPTRVKVSYYVDRSDADWDGLTGYITPEAITSVHGAPGNERSKVFVCGPPPMMNAVCGPKGANYTQGVLGDSALGKLGFNESEVFKF
jgi:cytochrome-b5 reductase